jgi:hypothetical protein
MSKLRNRGVGDLAGNPRVDGSPGPRKAIPAADEPVIKGMESAAQDGSTAGDQGAGGKHPPGSQRRNLPTQVQGLVAPEGYVP